jgi:NADH-quinone oxidoreductase subunit I
MRYIEKAVDKKFLVRKLLIKPLTLMEKTYVPALLVGFKITLRNFFKKPITVSYPEEKPYIAERFRGRHVLKRNEKGQERCTACHLCELVCPSHCITIESAPVPENKRSEYPEERYAKKYEIDMLRCIFCGLCEEACPKAAIFLDQQYTVVADNRADFIYDKEKLLDKEGSAIRYRR